ncbi:MAG: transposase, partial [Bacteroidales bacterium]|nr:transposase [Bacteroidales bacterium]
MAVLKSEIKRFRRFHGYDYSRGAVLFITFGLKKRLPVFGRAEGDKVVYNKVGEAAVETMQREMKRNANLVVHRFVVMPDHVHLRIYIRPNTKEPLVQVGRFVQNFKRWSKWRASQLGVDIEWQDNYHDRLCVSAEIIDLVDKYIDNNALKWVLMHGANPPMRVIEPLDTFRWPMDEWWTGVGNVDLIGENSKLAAFKLSRSIPRAEISAVVERCLGAVKKGFIPISTFISPAELALKRALIEAKLPMIRVVPDALATVYR